MVFVVVLLLPLVFAFYYLGKNNDCGAVRLIFVVSLTVLVAVIRELSGQLNPVLLLGLVTIPLSAWGVGISKSFLKTLPPQVWPEGFFI